MNVREPETRTSLDDDLNSAAFLTEPYPTYERLRIEDPVHWSADWQCWIVSRHADVSTVLRQDGKQFSTVGRVRAAVAALPPDVQANLPTIRRHYEVGLIQTDPPDHTRLRALVNKVFTPRSVEVQASVIDAVANDLLDAAAASGEIDVIHDFALPLTARVVSAILGVPLEHDRIRTWIDNSHRFLSGSQLDLTVALRTELTLTAARTFLNDIANERRADPRDDLISRLVLAEGRGELGNDEMLSTLTTFIIGGYVTTAALISSGVYALICNPDQLDLLLEDSSLMPGAVEEFLRYDSPGTRVIRVARGVVDVDGSRIADGGRVMLLLGSANRDREAFSDPERLDIRRHPNRHLAFAAGAHFCAGAPLARLETAVALGALLRRCPRPALAGGWTPDWLSNPSIRLLATLPISLN